MARGGRRSGIPNYRNALLISIIEEIKPTGALQWQTVAEIYQLRSGEALMRNPDDIKKHWHNTLCNKLNKPTGRTGGITDRILRCIRIQGNIMKKTDSVMMGIGSDDDTNYMYNGNNADDEDEDDKDEDEDGDDDDDRKPAAMDDVTIARLVEESMVAAPPLPLLPPADLLLGGAPSLYTGEATAAGAATAATATSVGAAAATATNGVVAGAATASTAATPGDTGSRKKKLKAVNEKTKNSSNVNHERGSIRKTMDRLADALITRPSLPTPAAVNPILEHNVMSHLVSREVDRVMDVHRGYLRDLARRSRQTGKMLKRLMKESKDSKRKAKKQKQSASGAKENEDGENNTRDSDSENSSSSSSSSSSDEE